MSGRAQDFLHSLEKGDQKQADAGIHADTYLFASVDNDGTASFPQRLSQRH
jgi:hypothetical protein